MALIYILIVGFFPFLLILLRFLCRPHPVKIPIKGRHVFITGGSSGIGLALAHQAASSGARVSILARNMSKLRDAKKAIRKATGVDVTVYSADVRDMEAVRSAIDAAGTIDVLICNQGVFTPRELLNVDMEEVKFTLDVNVVGTIHLIKAALPKMKAAVGGLPRSIGIMSSQAGQVGIYGYTAYSASKFALRGLAESLQQEVVSDNIHISLIFPPDTETPGLIEEQKTRPEITNILAGSSGGLKAEDVAEKALAGIQSGDFIVSCNFLGHMLSVSTAGLSPQRSYIMAFIELFSIGLMRFIGLCFQWNWYGVISKYHKEQVDDSPPGTKVDTKKHA